MKKYITCELMKSLCIIFGFFLVFVTDSKAQGDTVELVGVYQGVSLFIQNPFIRTQQKFCVEGVYVNGNKLNLNYRLSALKIDFDQQDLYTPVSVKVIASDSLCIPVIINPDAILFHTFFKFNQAAISDSAIIWSTEGEKVNGEYVIEKQQSGIWSELIRMPSNGEFEKSEYAYIPDLEEGGNKFRVKYDFGNGRFLYSRELIFDFYPDPVTFEPKATRSRLSFSRVAKYEIYDPNSKLVMQGQAAEVDVRGLIPGDYVIYFDGKDPGVFRKE
ncbi:MAG: hypothetical protein JXQ90_03390 [Cyclobacteriaceae bacterium]